MKKYQKRVRLKEFSYRGCYRYFVTIVTDRKKKIFVSKEIVEQILRILKDLSTTYQFVIWVYCFMPDHFHVLIEGKSLNSDMKNLILRFKQKSAYEFKKLYKERLWQENYYEHILRRNEDTQEVVRYILENPLRKGLVKDILDYPYAGSFEVNIKDFYFYSVRP